MNRQDLTTVAVPGATDGEQVLVKSDHASTVLVSSVYPGWESATTRLDADGIDGLVAALMAAKKSAFGPWLSSVA